LKEPILENPAPVEESQVYNTKIKIKNISKLNKKESKEKKRKKNKTFFSSEKGNQKQRNKDKKIQ
jgi:hypothetical protein